jgi:hypothetical protein
MRIAFIASSLQSLRDGVGDYTRDLARECKEQGHTCILLALHDRHLTAPFSEDDEEFPTLRVSPAMNWRARSLCAERFLNQHNPDWVSFQFVCYGFQDRGIVRDFANNSPSLVRHRRAHVMFHELWTGGPRARLKERLNGTIQKFFILKWCRNVNPRVVHTSNAVYADLLLRHGIPARRLPLFGSIRIGDANADDWVFDRLAKAGLSITAETRASFWLFGIFGTLHPIWPPEPLLTEIKAAANSAKRSIVLISIGRIGSGAELWRQLARNYSPEICFLTLGELPGEVVSSVFNSLDFGIATTPMALLGKSASATAMLEHGLPLIVNRDKSEAPLSRSDETVSPLVIRLNAQFAANLFMVRRIPPRSRLAATASQFLNDLAAGFELRDMHPLNRLKGAV